MKALIVLLGVIFVITAYTWGEANGIEKGKSVGAVEESLRIQDNLINYCYCQCPGGTIGLPSNVESSKKSE
jgi:hypothetical protein